MHKRLVLSVLLLLAITTFFALPTPALAYDYVPSALLQQLQSTITPTPAVEHDNRAKILQKYLEQYNSPLAPFSQSFVEEADQNNIDWKLVAAISGVESGFGLQIPSSSYNGWGYGVFGNNVRKFSSWEEAIKTISHALRADYMDKWGAQNTYQIGHIYAADPFWSGKVTRYISEIETLEKNNQQPPKLSLAL